MDGQSYGGIQWIQHGMKTAGHLVIDPQPPHAEEIMANGEDDADDGAEYLVDEVDDENVQTEADIDQIAAENLIFMARDGQMVTEIIATATDENGTVVVSASDGTPIDCDAVMQQTALALSTGEMTGHAEHEDTGGGYTEDYSDTTPQMVTEEVITDDWVQHQGEERVEIPADQIISSSSLVLLDNEVPLPTVQDEYTALRPYPCDFCSRRFRKKASLMNHMVAHQNDRPHLCKLCTSRFFRRSDLINHLKAHAEAPDPPQDAEFMNLIQHDHRQHRHTNDHYYDQDWSMQQTADAVTSISARTNKSYNVSGNSSSTSTSTAAATTSSRGRISRLKPKEENYTINEELEAAERQQLQQQHQTEIDFVEDCQDLQASTAAVKLSQDQSPTHQRHYPIIDDSKPFVCQQCGLAFAREKALLSHAKNHRNDAPHECNHCNEMFWDAASLQEHQKTHHFEESNSEYDPDEEAEEDTQSESESERLYGEFYCSECGMAFHRQDLLFRHARILHKGSSASEVDNSKDRHCCNTCGETFAEALDLLAHAEIHARYPPFKCVLCGETFFEEVSIKRHLQSNHANDMTPNSCILCGKECRDRKALIKHAWDHSREKCHSCSKCGKNFHNKARLKRHMASHRDKSVTCDVCHEEFPDGRTLSNHRHSHSASASGKLFPCHECGKTFGSRSSQQIHVRIHTGERPYGCRFCWKAFADGGTLRKHERIHTGEKPYACSVCPRAFNQRVVLREHIRSHHSGLDAKRGTYFCTVCSAELTSSNDLIKHLIQHSDMNTAMQRQPVTGPRKYKRRRKLKPHEIAHLRRENENGNGSEDIDISDFDMDNVDDLLGITETAITETSNSTTTANAKRGSKARGREADNNTRKGSNSSSILGEDVSGSHGSGKKKRYNSSSSTNIDKLWQTKLIHTNSNDDNYKSLLSNLENTLQDIDTLVVGSSSGAADKRSKQKTNDGESTAQRTQQVQIIKMETKYSSEVTITATASIKTRKKPNAAAAEKTTPKQTRPRMIHTAKLRVAGTDASTSGGNSKRRGAKTYITRTEHASVSNMATTIADDYEIISPATQPPNQISSSPLHIKQEHDQQHSRQHSQHQRNGDFYDAQLLLDASTLRKETYEKFNPSIVNDLEEILRSPIKSDRQRFTSESSTHFLAEQSEEDQQHLIKIEPTSPDLREIVVGVGASADAGLERRRSTRTTRTRSVTANRKYLEFETDVGAGTAEPRDRDVAHQQKHLRPVKSRKKETARPVSKAYIDDAVSSSFSAISAVVSAADAIAAAADAAANAPPPERKPRYFECEMCSAIFPDRAQLLDHVPIHI